MTDNECLSGLKASGLSDEKVVSLILQCQFYQTAAGGRAFYGVVFQSFDFWDCGFVSGRGRGCSSVVLVECCLGSGLCVELISCAEECYRLCVI